MQGFKHRLLTTNRWINAEALAAECHDNNLFSWLTHAGSFTQAFNQLFNYPLQVEVLTEKQAIIAAAEANYLNLPHHATAHVREVKLYSENIIFMYARTVIPLPTWDDNNNALGKLGDTPLGYYLFQHPSMQRSSLEFMAIDKTQSIWARRSQFYLDKKPLALYEIFLPSLKLKCCR
ncbi:MAG: chorismate lyase [Legionellales bacterium]|nr:chorismate lyase [Legionellales bacterium]